jgi:hypothetical protein
VGVAKLEWSGLNAPNHFGGSQPSLSSLANNTPFSSLSVFMAPTTVDVTSQVAGWMNHPANNRGFILTGASAPSPSGDGIGECLSGLGNFQLEIYYFAP